MKYLAACTAGLLLAVPATTQSAAQDAYRRDYEQFGITAL